MITFNNFVAQATSFYKRLNSHVEERRNILSSLLQAGLFDDMIQHAGRFAGRRPALHIETGLLNRVLKANLGHFVQQFGLFKSEQFEEQLDKAEKLMSGDPKFKGDPRKLIEASWRVFQACRFPESKFTPVTIEQAAEEQINKSSSSGFPLFQKKGKILDILIKDCKLLFTHPEMWFWPITRGFRIQLRDDNGTIVPKIRVMYPFPGNIILLEDTFIMPFVQHFINTDTFYVIGRNGKQVSDLLRTKLSAASNILSSDVSAFDQNMLNETIIAAFGILRAQLRLTKDQALIFEQMVAYFCTSLAVSKAGKAKAYGFIKTHGVPSGSGFTNMIDTLAHAIVLEYLEPGILERCLICGDDNIVSLKQEDTSKLFNGYEEIFNLPISREKTEIVSSSNKFNFLGFTWNNFVRYVNPRLVINQMLWHTDFIVDLDLYERELARGASVLLNGYNGKSLFTRIFPDVMKSLSTGVDVRFIYLFGYQPASGLPSLSSFMKTKAQAPSINESLKLHIDHGYLIR